jgi:hypothetical protein
MVVTQLEEQKSPRLVNEQLGEFRSLLQTTQGSLIELFEFLLGLLIVGIVSETTLTILGDLYDIPPEKIQAYFVLYMTYFFLMVIWRHLTFGYEEL